MPISLQIQMQLAKLRHWRRCGRWTLWLMEDEGMSQKKFGKTSAVTFGSSDLNMHFCLEALRLSRAQPMPIKSNQARCHNFWSKFQNKLSAKKIEAISRQSFSFSESCWPPICTLCCDWSKISTFSWDFYFLYFSSNCLKNRRFSFSAIFSKQTAKTIVIKCM